VEATQEPAVLVVLGAVVAVPVLYCTMDKWWPWPLAVVAVVAVAAVPVLTIVCRDWQGSLAPTVGRDLVSEQLGDHPQQELPPVAVVVVDSGPVLLACLVNQVGAVLVAPTTVIPVNQAMPTHRVA